MSLISADLRAAVVARAGDRCEYCRLSQDSQVATFPVDHVIPVVLNGPTSLENLAEACPRCNAGKWTRTEAPDPLTGTVVPLFNSRRDVWTDHVRWSETDPAVLEGLSAVGRATIVLLEMNAAQHLRVRRLLAELGLHPPV